MIRRFIETHLGLMMLLACATGLVVPGIAVIPNESAIVALALLMFVSCYKLRDGGFDTVNWRQVMVFYVLRYVLLPLVLYTAALTISPTYAIGVFLLSAVPAGASSPAFTNLYGGTAVIAFALVLVSQILTPLVIPLQFALVGGGVHVSPTLLFHTLVLTILVPMALYRLARRHKPSADYFYDRNKLFSILIIFFVIMLVVAKQRDTILSAPVELLPPLALVLICYAAYIVFGWIAVHNAPPVRLAYAVTSGFNNAALGVSLALLYFPPPIVLFFAAAEIGWSLLPAMMRIFLRFLPR